MLHLQYPHRTSSSSSLSLAASQKCGPQQPCSTDAQQPELTPSPSSPFGPDARFPRQTHAHDAPSASGSASLSLSMHSLPTSPLSRPARRPRDSGLVQRSHTIASAADLGPSLPHRPQTAQIAAFGLPARPSAPRGSSTATVSTIRPSSITSPVDMAATTADGALSASTPDLYQTSPAGSHQRHPSGEASFRRRLAGWPIAAASNAPAAAPKFICATNHRHRPHRSESSAASPTEWSPSGREDSATSYTGTRINTDPLPYADNYCFSSSSSSFSPEPTRYPYHPSSLQPSPQIVSNNAYLPSWAENDPSANLSRSSTMTAAGPNSHWAHPAPRETTVLDSGVDPVSGSKRINQYLIMGELGRGVYGKVKLGKDLNSGHMVAIKIVERTPKQKRLGRAADQSAKIRREIAILKKARHQNIVGLIEVIDDPDSKKVYIVLEYVEMGEVRWRVPALTEIGLVEYRRFLRESRRVSQSLDDSAALVQDNEILMEASRRPKRMAYSESGSAFCSFSRRASFKECSDSDTIRQSLEHNSHDDYPQTSRNSVECHLASNQRQTPTCRFDSLDDASFVPDDFRYVPLMTLDRARRVFRDTILGVEYLHYQGIIHRDIKPANLLETKEGVFKISDFGVSYLGRVRGRGEGSESDADGEADSVELAKSVGTPAFHAPEMCIPDTVPPQNAEKADIWALGVMLYCFVYGRLPFNDPSQFGLMEMIANNDVFFPRYRLKAVMEDENGEQVGGVPIDGKCRMPTELEYEAVNPDLLDLLRRLFVKDPVRRASIYEIKRHPWLVCGIDNPNEWADSTDPIEFCEGKKIEVSSKDVVDAVVSLSIVERVASVARRIGGALGVVRHSTSRRRTPVENKEEETGDARHGRFHRRIASSRSREFEGQGNPDMRHERSRSMLKGLIHGASSRILRTVRSGEENHAAMAQASGSTSSAVSTTSGSSHVQHYPFSAGESTFVSPLSSLHPSRSHSMSSPLDQPILDAYAHCLSSDQGHTAQLQPAFIRRPAVHPSQVGRPVTSSSSEGSHHEITPSTSFPSIPSVISKADVRVNYPDQVNPIREETEMDDSVSPRSIVPSKARRRPVMRAPPPAAAGFGHEAALSFGEPYPTLAESSVLESDNESSSDDDDGAIFIPHRRRSHATSVGRTAAPLSPRAKVVGGSEGSGAALSNPLRRAATVSVSTSRTHRARAARTGDA